MNVCVSYCMYAQAWGRSVVNVPLCLKEQALGLYHYCMRVVLYVCPQDQVLGVRCSGNVCVCRDVCVLGSAEG